RPRLHTRLIAAPPAARHAFRSRRIEEARLHRPRRQLDRGGQPRLIDTHQVHPPVVRTTPHPPGAGPEPRHTVPPRARRPPRAPPPDPASRGAGRGRPPRPPPRTPRTRAAGRPPSGRTPGPRTRRRRAAPGTAPRPPPPRTRPAGRTRGSSRRRGGPCGPA